MRRRLSVLAAATAAAGPLLLSAASAPLPARPAAVRHDACPPGHGGTPDTGLDGGPGCRELGEVEGLAKLTAPRTAAAGARSVGESGADRLAAYRYATAMRRAAEADAARAGRPDYATKSGAVVPGSGTAWRSLGPAPLNFDDQEYPQSQLGLGRVSGRVAAIAIDRTDPTGNTVYTGTAGGGVWKTTNAGEKWVPVGDTLPTQSIGAVAVDRDNGWVFVGTGESNTGTDNYAGLGLFRSKDGGATWFHSPGSRRTPSSRTSS